MKYLLKGNSSVSKWRAIKLPANFSTQIDSINVEVNQEPSNQKFASVNLRPQKP